MSPVSIETFSHERVNIDVDAHLQGSKRLRDLKQLLRDKYERRKIKDPEARARTAIEDLLVAAYSDAQAAFEGRKGAQVDRLVALQGEALSIYDQVLHSRGEPDLSRLQNLFKEMEGEFDQLRQPIDECVANAPKAQTEKAARALRDAEPATPSKDVERVDAFDRLKGLDEKEKWTVDGNQATRKYADGSKLTLHEDSGRLVVTVEQPGKPPTTFREFDVLTEPYSAKPKSSEVMQAHHGCQDALMKKLFGKAYDGGEAPTIWLRDSTTGSPHGVVTHTLQPDTLAKFANDPSLSYGKIRDVAVGEMKQAGVPLDKIAEYLKAIDNYVDQSVAPGLADDVRAKVLGDRTKYY